MTISPSDLLIEPCEECNGVTRTWPCGAQDAQHQRWCKTGIFQSIAWSRNPDPDEYYGAVE